MSTISLQYGLVRNKNMICFVMIILCFHVYDDFIFQVCDEDYDYDYEMTFLTLFIISKLVSWTNI